jgi:tetratricopeptide (TPR) repeat protein
MNRLGDALTYFRHAEQLAAKILGPDHPKVAAPLNNEGEVLNALHRYEEARAPLERAAQIWKRAGSSPFYWALALTNLGETLLGLGRPREAETLLEEAVGLFPSDQNPFLPAAQFALARALWTVPEERARGIQLARAARAHADRSGSIGARAPTIDAWLREHSGR